MKTLYSLFRRQRPGPSWEQPRVRCTWERVGLSAYSKPLAVRVFQNQLIAGSSDSQFEYRLRPVSQ